MRYSIALVTSVLLLCGCGDDSQGHPFFPGNEPSVNVTALTTNILSSAGDTTILAAVVRDASQKVVTAPSVTWTSSAPAVATVTGAGTGAFVQAVGDGTATITASSGSQSGTVTITVHRVATSIELASGATVIAPGETTQLTVVARDARHNVIPGVTGFTYATSVPGKVIVSPTGLLTAILPFNPLTLTASLTRDNVKLTGSTSFAVISGTNFDFASHMLGDDERPNPVVSEGEGLAYFRLQDNRVQYLLTWIGLSGPAVSAHIHGPGTSAQAVDVLVDFAPPNQTSNFGVLQGSIAASDIRPQGGRPPITLDSLVALMRSNSAYVNVHTATNVSGEIRGQIVGPFR